MHWSDLTSIKKEKNHFTMRKIQGDIKTEAKKSVERILQYPGSNTGGLEVVRMVRPIRESSRWEKALSALLRTLLIWTMLASLPLCLPVIAHLDIVCSIINLYHLRRIW